MRIRTTRQAREIRLGVNLARDPAITSRNGEFLYQYPLMHRAYIRTRNLPPAGVNEQLRVDHPDRKQS